MIKKIFKFKNSFSFLLGSFSLFVLPLVSLAQNSVVGAAKVSCVSASGIGNLLCTIQNLLNSIVPVLIALGVVYFVWGVVQYMIGDSEEAKKKGRDHVIYGIIGFAVIIGLWGLVTLVTSTFGLNRAVTVPLPSFSVETAAGGAASCKASTEIGKFLCTITDILNSIIPILLTLGVIYFIWGVLQYVIGDSEEAKKKGRDHIIYGIIGFVVIIGVWGLVTAVSGTFDLQNDVNLPTLVPTTTGAVSDATCSMGTNVQGLMNYATCLIQNSVIPLMFALAVAYFVWGILQFIMNSGEEAKRTQGKQHMIWGIIALTVMLSVWALVGILSGSLFKGGPIKVLPQVSPATRSQ